MRLTRQEALAAAQALSDRVKGNYPLNWLEYPGSGYWEVACYAMRVAEADLPLELRQEAANLWLATVNTEWCAGNYWAENVRWMEKLILKAAVPVPEWVIEAITAAWVASTAVTDVAARARNTQHGLRYFCTPIVEYIPASNLYTATVACRISRIDQARLEFLAVALDWVQQQGGFDVIEDTLDKLVTNSMFARFARREFVELILSPIRAYDGMILGVQQARRRGQR